MRTLAMMLAMAIGGATMARAQESKAELGALGDSALEKARPYLEKALKSPAAAEFEATGIAKIPPDDVHVGNRYRVTGHVDAPNALGVRLRMQWNATIRVADDRSAELHHVLIFPQEDKVSVLYEAPLERRIKPELIKRVRDDLMAVSRKVAARKGRVPKKTRDALLQREVLRFLGRAKTYGLTDEQMAEIVETTAAAAPPVAAGRATKR